MRIVSQMRSERWSVHSASDQTQHHHHICMCCYVKLTFQSDLKHMSNCVRMWFETDLFKIVFHEDFLCFFIKMDQNYRLGFLFQGVSCSGFISEFNKRQSRMLQFQTDLEEVVVQLDIS